MKIIAFLRTVISYLLIVIVCILLVPFLAILALLPEKYRYDNRLYFIFLYLFYRGVLYSSFLPIRIKGKKLDSDEQLIIVANHESVLDVLTIGYINGLQPHSWLVLEYYTKTPILGFFIRRMAIPVNRAEKVKSARSLVKLLRLFEQFKINVIIFPEGTRNKQEKIGEFFSGFAVLAQRTKKPVVPIFMPNNAEIYPVNSFLIHWYPIKAIIGEPIYFNQNESIDDFTMRVKEWFLEQSKIEALK